MDYLPALLAAAHDREPLIAEHARWAIDQIASRLSSSKTAIEATSSVRPAPARG
jgi:hypothetical protein